MKIKFNYFSEYATCLLEMEMKKKTNIPHVKGK